MGFLRRLFGGKKPDHPSVGSDPKPPKDKRRWSFAKHTKQKSRPNSQQQSSPLTYFESSTTTSFPDSLDANKHAIAVAAATAAVAEAALAAAHAAAEVVRLTSGGSGSGTGTVAYGGVTRPAAASFVGASQRRRVEELAAVRLQSAFRAYLARRALRALKALVKLQALVRGHIVRRQTADMLRRMQTLVRLQARARASRVHLSDHMHSTKSSLLYHPVPEDHEHPLCAYNTKFEGSSILKRCSSNANFRDVGPERPRLGSNWLDRWMEESVWTQHPRDGSLRHGHTDDDKSDKILEVDSWKPPHLSSHRSSSSFHASQFYPTSDYNNEMMMMAYDSPSKRSGKFPNQGSLSLKFHKGKEVAAAIASRTAENSPQALSASSRYANGVGGSRRGGGGGPFTPTRSECSWGYFGGYAGHPNYMANTESSKAKVRSQSAPKQRLEFERYGSTTGRNFQGLWDSDYTDRDFRGRGYYYPAASSHLNRVGSTNLR